MKLSTAIKQVRYLIDEPTPAFWTNVELTDYINEGCKDVARRAETKLTTYKITLPKTTIPKQNFTLPTDTYRIHRVEFYPLTTRTTLSYTLEFRGLMEMDQIWGINRQWPASYPLYYTLWKSPPHLRMITYPVSQTPGHFLIYYYQHITTAVWTTTKHGTTTTIDILAGYEDIVFDYAAYRALRKDNNPMWRTHQAVYEAKLTALVNRTRTFQDQGNFFSTGQASLPAWLISDDMGNW